MGMVYGMVVVVDEGRNVMPILVDKVGIVVHLPDFSAVVQLLPYARMVAAIVFAAGAGLMLLMHDEVVGDHCQWSMIFVDHCR